SKTALTLSSVRHPARDGRRRVPHAPPRGLRSRDARARAGGDAIPRSQRVSRMGAPNSVPVAPDRNSSWIVPPGAIGFNPVQWHSPVALPFVPRGAKGCAWHASPSVQAGAIIGCGWEGLQAKGWRAADGRARTGDAGRPAMAGWRVFFNQG